MKKTYLLCIALVASIISGCGGEKAEPKAQEIPKEKSVVVSTGGKPKSLDPAMYNEIPSLSIVEQIFNTLFTIDEAGMIQPELVDTYEYLSPTELVMTIKKGVKFHNGDELTAQDVYFSLNRMLEKPATQVMLSSIKTVEKVDDYTVKIILKESSAPLLYSLSYPLTAILSEKDTLAKNGDIATSPMGTGAYKFVKWGSGEKIELVAHDDYYAGRGKIDKLTFRAITEDSSRLAALEIGEVDIADVAPIDVQTVEAADNLTNISYSTSSTEYITFNNEKAPFNNINFRKAINAAIDKEGIIEAVYLGKASVANTIVNPNVFGSNQDIKLPLYDVEKAKAYLAESKVQNPTIKLMTNDNPVRVQAAQIIQANLKEIGIDVKIETVEFGTYLQLTAQGDYDMFLGGWVSGTLDSDIVLFPLFHSSYKGGAGNRSLFDNAELDRLVELGRVTVDPTERANYYKEAQVILADEMPIAPLYYKNANISINNKIKNFKVSPNTIHSYEKIDKE